MRQLASMAAAADAGFGTSGVRGLVSNLSPDLCAAYTVAFLSILESKPRQLLIGRDLRPSSPAIAAACHQAARSIGIETVDCGVLPTPAIAHAAQQLGLPAIMVTGSHIPFDRNGLKFYRAEGEISKEDEQRMLACEVTPHATAPALDLPAENREAVALYLARYRGAFAPGALSGLTIGVYEHSSVARDLLHELLRSFGAATVGLARSDGFVAIDTEAVGAEDRVRAIEWVRARPLDAIVTTDGDADRPLIADETGQWLRGDLLGLLCARELGARTVVTPVNATTALERSGLFAAVRRTRIGSPHVIAGMVIAGMVIAGMGKAAAAPIVGFEANGGLLLGSTAELSGGRLSALATRDAMLPILLVLAAAKRRGCRVSALAGDLPARHTSSGRLPDIDPRACRELIAAAEGDPRAMADVMGGAPVSLDRTDGLRATLADGTIIHVRLSGNAPELRCYTEAESPEAAAQLCEQALARLALLLSGRSGSTAPRSAGRYSPTA